MTITIILAAKITVALRDLRMKALSVNGDFVPWVQIMVLYFFRPEVLPIIHTVGNMVVEDTIVQHFLAKGICVVDRASLELSFRNFVASLRSNLCKGGEIRLFCCDNRFRQRTRLPAADVVK